MAFDEEEEEEELSVNEDVVELNNNIRESISSLAAPF
jgi:hypothetical protein